MFRIPEDIIKQLEKKFPEIDVVSLVDEVLRQILEKTLRDGSCQIREFGCFYAYVTRSGKINKDVIRFKFGIARSLEKKIKYDPYYLKITPIKIKKYFDESKDIEKNIRKLNIEAAKKAKSYGKEQSKIVSAIEEVENIVNELEAKTK